MGQIKRRAGWIPYTPTNENITIGNGAQTAEYLWLGPKAIAVRYTLTAGSTTVFGAGNVAVGLPFGVPNGANGLEQQLYTKIYVGGPGYNGVGMSYCGAGPYTRAASVFIPSSATSSNLTPFNSAHAFGASTVFTSGSSIILFGNLRLA